MKRTHSGLVKFKVALAALTGEPIADICKHFEIGESLVHKWKKQLKEHGAEIFSQRKQHKAIDHENEVAKLYQRIGQLTTELDFLKKVVED